MKLVDANVLIYAVNSDAAHHERSKDWLESALSGREPVGLTWGVLLAFLRVTTRRGILERPLPVNDALAYVDSWLQQPPVELVVPGPNHWTILRTLIIASGQVTRGPTPCIQEVAGRMTFSAPVRPLSLETATFKPQMTGSETLPVTRTCSASSS